MKSGNLNFLEPSGPLQTCFIFFTYYTLYIIQGVPGGKINILGGHSIAILCIKKSVAKSLIRKRLYVLFLIPVFIVQVTKLVQFT